MRDLVIVATVALLFDCIRMHYYVHSLKRRHAAMVAAALGPTVEVDGVKLPPYDDNWKICESYHNKQLKLGKVKVEHGGYIYVGEAIFMDVTAATRNYCDNVFRAYRSRAAAQR